MAIERPPKSSAERSKEVTCDSNEEESSDERHSKSLKKNENGATRSSNGKETSGERLPKSKTQEERTTAKMRIFLEDV